MSLSNMAMDPGADDATAQAKTREARPVDNAEIGRCVGGADPREQDSGEGTARIGFR
jgi:hypothetical protein